MRGQIAQLHHAAKEEESVSALTFYCGTGFFPQLRFMKSVARTYYSQLLGGLPVDRVILLESGGLSACDRRHQSARELALRNRRPARITMGQSQGGEEALEDALENPEVHTVVSLCAPLGGSWLASLSPLPGLRHMAPSSSYQEDVRRRTAVAVASRENLPDVHLLSAHHDGLVSCESAHALSLEYPAHKVHRYCVSSSDPGHGAGVEWIPVSPGFDTHWTLPFAPAVRYTIHQIVGQSVRQAA